MKLMHIVLNNHKNFTESRKFSFLDPTGNVNPSTVIVGGTTHARSAVLQAIVILLASVTRPHFRPNKLEWPNYRYHELQMSERPLKMEAAIEFSEKEIQDTCHYAQRLCDSGELLNICPSRHQQVVLSLNFSEKKVTIDHSIETFYQFKGYQYAKRLVVTPHDKVNLFNNVGNIVWYNKYRIPHSVTDLQKNNAPTLNELRTFLVNAHRNYLAIMQLNMKIQREEVDFYKKLKYFYSKIFSGISLLGSSQDLDAQRGSDIPGFFLNEGNRYYELAELSEGERNILPILIDFSRWHINNSIIVIDQIEMGLNHNLQANFIQSLHSLGNNNQFIFTSSYGSVTSLLSDSKNQVIKI